MRPEAGTKELGWNRIDCLKDCVKSLLKINYPNYEIIVVDNASTNGSPEEVERNFDSVKLIRNKENLGYAEGNNVGIKYAIEKGADYVLLLNDDVVVEPNILRELVEVAESDPEIGIAGPRILCFEEAERLYQQYGRVNYYFNVHHKNLYEISKPTKVDVVYGTALFVKKEVIEKVGFLDTNFFLYLEEADWCRRAKKAGYKIVHVPSARVYHKVFKSFSGRINLVVLYYNTRNELLFARKHLNPLLFFPLWIPRFIYRIIRYWFKTRNTQVVKAILKGFFDFAKNRFGKSDMFDPNKVQKGIACQST